MSPYTEVDILKQKCIALLMIATMALATCGAVGMASKADAATATAAGISVSNTAPRVNERVTFTVTFGSGGVRTFNAEFAGDGQFLWSHGADQKIAVIFM